MQIHIQIQVQVYIQIQVQRGGADCCALPRGPSARFARGTYINMYQYPVYTHVIVVYTYHLFTCMHLQIYDYMQGLARDIQIEMEIDIDIDIDMYTDIHTSVTADCSALPRRASAPFARGLYIYMYQYPVYKYVIVVYTGHLFMCMHLNIYDCMQRLARDIQIEIEIEIAIDVYTDIYKRLNADCCALPRKASTSFARGMYVSIFKVNHV